MSSMSSARKPGTLWIAACMAAAAMSSGRVADRAPLGALPTAVRTADTITAAIVSKSEFGDIGVRNLKFDLPEFPKHPILLYRLLGHLGRSNFKLRIPISPITYRGQFL